MISLGDRTLMIFEVRPLSLRTGLGSCSWATTTDMASSMRDKTGSSESLSEPEARADSLARLSRVWKQTATFYISLRFINFNHLNKETEYNFRRGLQASN